jgi:hypothetical protein
MMHYSFDDPMDITALLRAMATDVEKSPQLLRIIGPPKSTRALFQVAVGALRVAAETIEKAVYDASAQSSESGR